MSHTIATFHPKAHGHNDVREAQIRREDGCITVWLNTKKGPVLIRDRHLLDGLAATLTRAGLGARQQELDARGNDHGRGDAASEEREAHAGAREGEEQR